LIELAEGPTLAELAEEHGDKVALTSEAARLVFGSVIAYCLLEWHSWKEL
jgi:hypothetical protein